MSIVGTITSPPIKGSQGDEGPTSSGTLYTIAISAWGLGKGRLLLDDICCDSFVTTSGVDPSTSSYYKPFQFVHTPLTSSGNTMTLPFVKPYVDNKVYDEWEVIYDEWDYITTSGTPLVPPPVENAASIYSSVDNSMYIFGGSIGTSLSSDLWRYGFGTGRWTKISPVIKPEARQYSSLVCNPASGTLILYGGMAASGTVGDSWSYSISNNTWSSLTNLGNKPPARAEHNAVYDDYYNQVFVWGGKNHFGTFFNELYQYRFLDSTWMRVVDTGPGAKCQVGMEFDPVTRSFYTVQGYNTSYALTTEIYCYNTGANAWYQRHSTLPTARLGFSAVLDPINRAIIIMGGRDSSSLAMYDTTIYDIDKNVVFNSINTVFSRCNHCAIFNPIESSMYIFGGRETSSGPLLNSLYRYTWKRNPLKTSLSVVETTNEYHFLTKSWTHLDSIKISQTCKDLSSYVYTAVSFDERNSWKIYKSGIGWYSIAQTVSGIWQYKNLSGTWVNSLINTSSGALSQSFSIGNNQWYREEQNSWNDVDKSSIPVLSSNSYSKGNYVSSASSQYNADTNAYRAFQGYVSFGADAAYWLNSAAPINGQWLQIDLGDKPICPTHWRIMAPWYNAGTGARCPKRFTISGSNNGSTWETIDNTFRLADMPNPGGDKYSAWYPTSTTVTGTYRYIRLSALTSQIDTSYVGIKKLDFKTAIDINSLPRSSWEAPGGFVPGVTSSIDLAAGLKSGNTNPYVNSFTANYTTSESPSSDLITQEWGASVNDPYYVQCIIKCKLIDSLVLDTDLKVYVSTNGGSSYEQITGLKILSTVGDYSYIIGHKEGLSPTGSNRIKTKVSTLNFKNVMICGVCLGVDYLH